MKFNFKIKGTVTLACDRCTEMLPYPIETKHQVLVKLEEQEGSVSDEIVFLSPDAYEYNVAELIYDFHTLSIPLKKECQHISDRCNEIDAMLNSYNRDEETNTDPRWDELKKLL